ncbi:LamG domain-containing protein [Micromonospora noduli]|nr:LamG domain-containing protein [Micromonospora noduli]
MVVATAGVVLPVAAAPAAAACAGEARTEMAAAAMAAACDQAVVVDASRSEYARVVAQPDGRMTFESAVVPQWTRKTGGWTDINLELFRDADGLLRPRASAADVTFSSGGSGPLVIVKNAAKTMTMSWSGGSLPEPAVDGDSATFPNVLPDVDLVLRATRVGFTHVLVVKSAGAASNPAVRQIRFDLGGDAQVRHSPSGALKATAGAVVVASAEPAAMWDSRPSTVAAKAIGRNQSAGDEPSSDVSAGDAAQVAPVAAQITGGGDLLLTPDPALLDSPNAHFPIYIDPQWRWSDLRNKWAYSTNNGSSNSDYSVARVGLNPDTGAIYRSYFEFPTVADNRVSLKGKFIADARVEMKVDHTHSCDDTPTWMYLSPAIDKTMRATWSKMGLSTMLTAAGSHANEAGGCGAIQPDMTVQFESSAVTTQLRAVAGNSWSTMTLGFSAAGDKNGSGESTQSRWKKYFPGNAKLFVDYDSKPGAPAGLQVAGVACNSGVLMVGTFTPTLRATFPDADSWDSLTAHFEWIEVPSGGMATVTDTSPARKPGPGDKTGITPNTVATSVALSGLVKDKTYAYRVKSTDTYFQSAWSPWCRFAVDNTRPPVTVTMVTAPPSPGRAGRFRIESSDTTVASFTYGWGSAGEFSKPAQGTSPKYVEVDATAPSYGRNVFKAKAIDGTLNESNEFGFSFMVGTPLPAIAQWGLETYPGIDQAAALADKSGVGASTPLTATSVGWTDDVRMVDGMTATFNGSSSQAASSGPVVDTTKSFTVAAWVRPSLIDTVGDRNVLGQDPAMTPDTTMAGGFYLGVRRDSQGPHWSFHMRNSLDKNSSGATIYAPPTLGSADIGRWVHLAGVYDAAAKTMQLYVNGADAGETPRAATPWAATGRFTVGRTFWGGGGNWWAGNIADVQVFDRAIVPHDFTGILKDDPDSGGFDEPGMLTPIQVGGWGFESDPEGACWDPTIVNSCEAKDTTAWDRWLALSKGVEVDTGRGGDGSGGLFFDSGLDDDADPNTPPAPTTEFGRSAYKLNPIGEVAQWQATPVLRTDQSFTVSVWVRLEQTDDYQTVMVQHGAAVGGFYLYYGNDNGGVWKLKMLDTAATPDDGTGATFATAPAPNVGDTWQHLVGVLDADRRQLKLYVNGERMTTTTLRTSWRPWQANGPLLVGRNGTWNPLHGTVDDLGLYQGAMTDAQVLALHQAQEAS